MLVYHVWCKTPVLKWEWRRNNANGLVLKSGMAVKRTSLLQKTQKEEKAREKKKKKSETTSKRVSQLFTYSIAVTATCQL